MLNRLFGILKPLEVLPIGDNYGHQITRRFARKFLSCCIYPPCPSIFKHGPSVAFLFEGDKSVFFKAETMDEARDTMERVKTAILNWGAGLPVTRVIKADWTTTFAKSQAA